MRYLCPRWMRLSRGKADQNVVDQFGLNTVDPGERPASGMFDARVPQPWPPIRPVGRSAPLPEPDSDLAYQRNASVTPVPSPE